MVYPFDTVQYEVVYVKLKGFEELKISHDTIFYHYSNATCNKRRLLLEDLFTPKEKYIAHNNEVRKTMLGLTFAADADYVLPWDRN